ncbi:MAG TPA: Dabb family protein [Mesorhizobium sp.]|nr:Dabb family protein [Mesorhizobium sp.]
MIRHIVFFSAGKPEHVPAVLDGLRLLQRIPHGSVVEVRPNLKIDQLANEVDAVVYAEFADEAALLAYKAHPLYAEATARVRPLRELRIAADVSAGPDEHSGPAD